MQIQNGRLDGVQDIHTDHEYEYAGFWVRLGAYIVDAIVFAIICGLIAWILSQFVNVPIINEKGTGLFDLVNLIITPIVAIVMWIKLGATPGKILFNLQVLDEKTGSKLTTRQAILRYIGYIPSAIILLLGFIWVAWDKKKQGWHDKIAKTVVVKVLS